MPLLHVLLLPWLLSLPAPPMLLLLVLVLVLLVLVLLVLVLLLLLLLLLLPSSLKLAVCSWQMALPPWRCAAPAPPSGAETAAAPVGTCAALQGPDPSPPSAALSQTARLPALGAARGALWQQKSARALLLLLLLQVQSGLALALARPCLPAAGLLQLQLQQQLCCFCQVPCC
jgi:hypothetical protein